MKKIIILSFVMLGWELSAQVVLTQSNFPTAGTTVHRNIDTLKVEFDPGTAGNGNVWNYGGLNADSIAIYNFVNPSSTPYASDFPGANLAITVGNDLYGYLNISNSIAEELGFAGDGASLGAPGVTFTAKYNQPLTIMPFPAQFGTTFTDSSRVVITLPGSAIGAPVDSVRVKRAINRNGSFDASGSLAVNAENWQNALRFNKNEVTTDSFFVYILGQWQDASGLGAPPSTSNSITYEWYVNGQNYPVFVAEMNAIGDSALSREFYVSGTSKSKASSTIFSVYPNPASDFLHFTGDLTGVQNIVIYNTLGQKQNTSFIIKNQQAEVALNGLSNGIYIYQIIGKDSKIISSGKFVVEK